MNHQVYYSVLFDRKYRKYKKLNQSIFNKITSTICKLQTDPFQQSLKTHQVNLSNFGECFSSRVSGNVRIIWKFKKNVAVILCLNIGGHDDVY